MSRSRRHNPIIGITTAESDKPAKVIANRRYRHRVKAELRSIEDYDAEVLPLLREVSNAYTFPKDGKCILFGFEDKKLLAKLMRK